MGKKATPKSKKSPKKVGFYPADDVATKAPSAREAASRGIAKLRSSITPGTVLILLSGRFRGRRVVFLKQLPSGLLLVTGPFSINGVPMKRVNQAYVIATSTKVDLVRSRPPRGISGWRRAGRWRLGAAAGRGAAGAAVRAQFWPRNSGGARPASSLPLPLRPSSPLTLSPPPPRSQKGIDTKGIEDGAFAKPKDLKGKKEADFFAEDEGKKALPAEYIAMQNKVDTPLAAAVKKTDKLAAYLKARFTLSKGDVPHKMVF